MDMTWEEGFIVLVCLVGALRRRAPTTRSTGKMLRKLHGSVLERDTSFSFWFLTFTFYMYRACVILYLQQSVIRFHGA